MSRTIVIANQKGGVGKTTTVANLGAALTALGKQVLLIDLDPQAALSATFGVDPYSLTHTMASILLRSSMPFSRILRPVGVDGKIALAPGGMDLAAAEVHLATKPDRTLRLKQVLEKNRVPFDYILIDTPPSLGLLTLNGLVAADEVLVPVQSHFLAMRGVRALMETIWRVKRRLNPDLRLLGLLPTMFERDSRHAEEVVEELNTVFKSKVFDMLIIHSLKFAEAPVANQTVVDSAPDHEGAVAYRKLAEEIVSHG